jgi:hypothetical protein
MAEAFMAPGPASHIGGNDAARNRRKKRTHRLASQAGANCPHDNKILI